MLTDKIATFEKVTEDQFIKDSTLLRPGISINEIKEEYNNIKIPSRATSGSVGFDFYLPFDIDLRVGEAIVIPTGIRCKMEEGYSLDIYPKSGLGFKNFTTIANTIGIIDSDYYYSDNEGHIMVKLINKGFDVNFINFKSIEVMNLNLIRKQGESFVQGILHECFGATNDDLTKMIIRNGGFDSTNKTNC
jgi:dUTP pyrophosphatase